MGLARQVAQLWLGVWPGLELGVWPRLGCELGYGLGWGWGCGLG